jgi:hypothetical protein
VSGRGSSTNSSFTKNKIKRNNSNGRVSKRERDRERERGRERETQRERDRERQRERDREGETERQRRPLHLLRSSGSLIPMLSRHRPVVSTSLSHVQWPPSSCPLVVFSSSLEDLFLTFVSPMFVVASPLHHDQ